LEGLTVARIALTPVRWVTGQFNRWTKKRGSDRNALVREGSELVTPVIDLTKQVGPAAIMFGTNEEITARMRGLDEEWTEQRRNLLTYANAHPSEDVRKLAAELSGAVGTSFSATWYLFVTRDTAVGEEGMENFHNAERRQQEAIALTEKLLEKIRRY
jgi:hypothetical protein